MFLSFFPHVVAGPIVRPAEFMPQLRARHDPRYVDASRAFFLIFIGLFKKVVIANLLATEIVDAVFASPKQHSSLEILVGIYAYAVQIYADFSGYTDMAIGIALLLGFRFPQNFDSPYTSTSIQDFWRRWHMTLSRWLRDYLYIPLGGNRGGRFRTYFNLMLTMLLGGLWHGAAWTFVVWGGIHGFYLCVEHARRARRTRLESPRPAGHRQAAMDATAAHVQPRVLRVGVLPERVALERLRAAPSAGRPEPLVRAGAARDHRRPPRDRGGDHRAVRASRRVGRAMSRFSYFAPVAQGLVLGVVILITNTMGPRGVAPFIYFRF